MTCIVGYSNGDEVWLGSDSAASSVWRKYPIKSGTKLFDINTGSHRILFGYTTSFRFGQLLQFQASPPHDVRKDPHEYLVRDFIPSIRTLLSDGGWTRKDDERESAGSGLIGYRSRLFHLQNDFSVVEPGLPYFATGSGTDFALGAMHHSDGLGRKPETVLLAGLNAAGELDPNVMAPFDLIKAKS